MIKKYNRYKINYFIGGSSESKDSNQHTTLNDNIIFFFRDIYLKLKSENYTSYQKILPLLCLNIPNQLLRNIMNNNQGNYLNYLDSIDYSEKPDVLRVYHRGFFKLKNVNLNEATIYAEMYGLDLNSDLQKNIFNQIIRPVDIAKQIIFYQNLSPIAKEMFTLQKRSPDKLKFFRLSPVDMMEKLDLHQVKLLNIFSNIYYNIPGITDDFFVYRCETLWEGTREMIQKYFEQDKKIYTFNGVTSTSTDPRIGYSFNKIFNYPDDQKIIFKIKIPKETKVIVPSVNCNNLEDLENCIDPEFEILLFNRAKIRILSIKENKTVNFYPSETMRGYDINMNRPIQKTFKYFVTAEFIKYEYFY
jgi:hypothetical protein